MTRNDNVRHMWSEDDLDQVLAGLHAEVPPGDEALARARANLMSAAGVPEPVAKKRHWGRWAAAVVTVAAVTAAVLVVPTLHAPPSSAAADVLNRAADRIGASDPVVGPGQYLYVEWHGWHQIYAGPSGRVVSWIQQDFIERWVPSDRSQEWLMRIQHGGDRKLIMGTEADLRQLGWTIDPPHAEPDQVAKCGDFHVDHGHRPCEPRPGSWWDPTPEFLASLPDSPQLLHDRLRADIGKQGVDPDVEMVDTVAEVIQLGLVPAKVRANLYRALALMPTLQVSDQNANLDGRIGIGLGATGGGTRQELIIDPGTGQMIGERTSRTVETDGAPPGLRSYTAVSTGVVDKAGDKPAR